ncbi:TetR/AcrR family transcriptional regulator [Mesorhizobium sp. ANAO-SY3R2]|uniref:TetR/AcrR family transcriptional regulator n=1 Tax=Mesorhizobium sp. ANAO-SY3R2 TaxID=3166644 RepID=UPI00366FCD75
MAVKNRRRRLTKEVRESQILDAAAELFREKGYYTTSTSEIAQKAGVVEGTIFRYFATKRDLLFKVAESAYLETIADYDSQLQGIAGTWNRLRYLIWRHLKGIHDQPAIHRLIQYEIKHDPEYRSSRIFQLNRAYTRRTTETIEAAIRSGEFISSIPATLARDAIYGAIEHHVWRFARGEAPLDIDETADQTTNLIYRALVAPSSQTVATDLVARIDERLARIETTLDRQALAAGDK